MSDQYGVSLTLPPGESWIRGSPLTVPAGDMIFIASHPESKQTVAVIAIPRIPSNELENPAVVSRIIEAVMGLGFSVVNHAPVTINEQKFLQLLGKKSEGAASEVVCVARAAIRNNTIHLALTFARGNEERATEKYFLRVLDTFTLLEMGPATLGRTNHALFPLYRTAYMACWIAAGSLMLAAAVVFLISRRPAF